MTPSNVKQVWRQTMVIFLQTFGWKILTQSLFVDEICLNYTIWEMKNCEMSPPCSLNVKLSFSWNKGNFQTRFLTNNKWKKPNHMLINKVIYWIVKCIEGNNGEGWRATESIIENCHVWKKNKINEMEDMSQRCKINVWWQMSC